MVFRNIVCIYIVFLYTGDNGMILELCKYQRNAFYFDCFLSGFDKEEEYLSSTINCPTNDKCMIYGIE